ncbi:trypsin-like peptidase domain-containing protein [bacterium]|nr:trypsin-like peptidase domain-containing protein [bacterium]
MKKGILKKILSLIFIFLISISLVGCSFGSIGFIGDEPTTKTTNTQEITNLESQEVREKNAYEIAVENGYEGSLDEWLNDLVKNNAYTSIYDLAKENGIFNGSLEDFIQSLKGTAGSFNIQEGTSYGLNSVVSILCNFTITSKYRDFWTGRTYTETSTSTSAGSGVIIEDDKENGVAYIITNYHVVYYQNADSPISNDILIKLYGMELNKYKIPAKYIGGSSTYDIAVLRIESDIYKNSGAYKASMGDSSKLLVGNQVIAIGNPQAEGISATYGIISVVNDKISLSSSSSSGSSVSYREIRIDAAVNSGNSGGGLFDIDGNLIGIVNAKSVDTSIEGMCYAIPINLAYAVAKKIINTCDGETATTIKKNLLGIGIEVLSSRSEYDKETKTTRIFQEISVNEVTDGGVSYSKLMVGDIIVNITYNGVSYPVNDLYSLEDVLLTTNLGDTVELYIYRAGNYESIPLVLSLDTDVL